MSAASCVLVSGEKRTVGVLSAVGVVVVGGTLPSAWPACAAPVSTGLRGFAVELGTAAAALSEDPNLGSGWGRPGIAPAGPGDVGADRSFRSISAM